jgi:hypothetical protein
MQPRRVLFWWIAQEDLVFQSPTPSSNSQVLLAQFRILNPAHGFPYRPTRIHIDTSDTPVHQTLYHLPTYSKHPNMRIAAFLTTLFIAFVAATPEMTAEKIRERELCVSRCYRLLSFASPSSVL